MGKAPHANMRWNPDKYDSSAIGEGQASNRLPGSYFSESGCKHYQLCHPGNLKQVSKISIQTWSFAQNRPSGRTSLSEKLTFRKSDFPRRTDLKRKDKSGFIYPGKSANHP
jgi:hypothetical protein